MTNFIQKIGNPPIYTDFNKTAFPENAPQSMQGIDLIGKTNTSWQKWLGQIKDQLNINNYYGNPSVLLNSDFYWNTGVPTPTNNGSGDDAFFSEKWQVHGASVATYTITQTAFAGNDKDEIGSTTYIRVQASGYTTGDFYLFQRQTGSQFLRRYQNRSISFSILANNNNNTAIKVQLEIFIFFDPSSVVKSQGVIFLDPGQTETSSLIKTDQIGSTAVGAGAYVEFRFRFVDLAGSAADFNITYLKAELADNATVLYVDHALERARIDNS